LIGHLQSNKTAKALELFQVIETVDTPRLARRLGEQSPVRIDVMIEVKLSGEESKAGAPPERLTELIEAIRQQPKLQLMGLMTMPPWSEDAELSRPYFVRLRQLASLHGMTGLSMG